MSDAGLQHFIEQKVDAMNSNWDWLAGSDKTAAEQLTKAISNDDLTAKEREKYMDYIKNDAAQKNLPKLELINSRDTDGNGVADKFDGIKLDGRIMYEQPHQAKGQKQTEAEMVKMLTPYLKNDSKAGSEKIFKALNDCIRNNDMNEVQLRSLLYRLEDVSKDQKLPSKVGFSDHNGDPISLNGDSLYVSRPTTIDFSQKIKR